MPDVEKIAHFSNLAEAMTVVICKGQASYSVHMLDEDSGTYMPVVRHYPDLESAMTYARALINLEEKTLTVRL